MPQSADDYMKSPLFHDIRVGIYLLEHEYSREIVLAGFLHDALEHSEAKEDDIKNLFGQKVLELVKANSKDYSIEDSGKRTEELVSRTAKAGKDAMIIRAADTLDSFKHYTETQDQKNLEYCRKNAEEIFKHLTEADEEEVFKELKVYL
ncbi:MAG TPA: HD domain-containing protein, partial [Patescibacteria group bacterium]|nr:HD domain-containing protein [Patescibacteria group bacterium]